MIDIVQTNGKWFLQSLISFSMNTLCLSFYCLLGVGKKNENKREFILQNIGGCITVGKIVQTFFLTGITNTFEEIIKSGLKNIDLTKNLSFWESHAKK